MLPDISGGHSAYQNFVVTNLRKYYTNPDAVARSTWDIIDRFWNLDLSYTAELLKANILSLVQELRLACIVLIFYPLSSRSLL